MRERLHTEPYFATRAGELGLDPAAVRFVPDRVRAKAWKVLLAVYAGFAAGHGGRLIPPPDGAADETGLLAPAYWGTDITHANPLYGRLYLEKVLDHLVPGTD